MRNETIDMDIACYDVSEGELSPGCMLKSLYREGLVL